MKTCLDDSCDARGHCSVCGTHMLGSFGEYGFASCPSVCDICEGLPEAEKTRIRKLVRAEQAKAAGLQWELYRSFKPSGQVDLASKHDTEDEVIQAAEHLIDSTKVLTRVVVVDPWGVAILEIC